MPPKRVSIAQVMMVIALAAVNLTVMRAVPFQFVIFPILWILLGSLDFVIVRKLILRQSFGAFHYTFLVVVVVVFFVTAILVVNESIHLLALPVRWYQQLAGEVSNSVSLAEYIRVGEFWTVAFLSCVIAWTAGSVAAWLERRRGWDIAAFWRGTIFGLLIASVLALIYEVVTPEPGYIGLVPRQVVTGACVILGGLMGLRWLRSSRVG